MNETSCEMKILLILPFPLSTKAKTLQKKKSRNEDYPEQNKEQLCLILFVSFHKLLLLTFIFISPSLSFYLKKSSRQLVRLRHIKMNFNAIYVFSKILRRRKGEKLFLVAFYECNEDYELENLEQDRLYCSKEQWVGDTPKCMAINEEEENGDDDEEGA